MLLIENCSKKYYFGYWWFFIKIWSKYKNLKTKLKKKLDILTESLWLQFKIWKDRVYSPIKIMIYNWNISHLFFLKKFLFFSTVTFSSKILFLPYIRSQITALFRTFPFFWPKSRAISEKSLGSYFLII